MRSQDANSSHPAASAIRLGVKPSIQEADTPAQYAMSTGATSRIPMAAATCSGVCPHGPRAFTLAQSCNSNSSIPTFPAYAAHQGGDGEPLVQPSMLARYLSSAVAIYAAALTVAIGLSDRQQQASSGVAEKSSVPSPSACAPTANNRHT
jgi:hypothetical protein